VHSRRQGHAIAGIEKAKHQAHKRQSQRGVNALSQSRKPSTYSSATQTLTSIAEQHIATGTQTTSDDGVTSALTTEHVPEPTMLTLDDVPNDMEAAQLLLSAGDTGGWMVDADIWNRATQTLPTICDVGLQTPSWAEAGQLFDMHL
jgi:hypothetical protein